MKKPLRITFKIILWTVLSMISFVVLYVLASAGLSLVPVNADFRENQADSIEIFLRSNGIHTDIVLPLVNEYEDWTEHIDTTQTIEDCNDSKYIAFGWGDRELYVNTKEFEDLKFSTALRATFCPRSSVLHAEFYGWVGEDDGCISIRIDPAKYQMLVNFIVSGFSLDSSGNFLLIRGVSHGGYDLFYEARGSYHLFNTSNTWINDCLKAGRMKACLWTPVAQGFFYHYR